MMAIEEYLAKLSRPITEVEADQLAAELGATRVQWEYRALAVRFGDRPYLEDYDHDLWIGLDGELYLSFRSGTKAQIQAAKQAVAAAMMHLGFEIDLFLAD